MGNLNNFLKIGILLLISLLLFTPRILLAENLEEKLDLNGPWLFTLDPHNQGEGDKRFIFVMNFSDKPPKIFLDEEYTELIKERD